MQMMLTKLLLILACASALAWIAMWMREKGLRPLHHMIRLVRGLPPLGRAVVPVLFVVTWLAASTKPGDGGGTNNVPQMPRP